MTRSARCGTGARRPRPARRTATLRGLVVLVVLVAAFAADALALPLASTVGELSIDVRVQDGFYDGPGRRILRQYWLRMMIPFAPDIPCAIWIFKPGAIYQLNFLVLALSVLIHINHVLSVQIAKRQAQPYAVAESTRPAARPDHAPRRADRSDAERR